jgi:hypothetical protein
MKNITAQKRYASIKIQDQAVDKIIKSIVYGDTCEGVSYSVFKMMPGIQFFNCNVKYHLYEKILNALKSIGIKTKSYKNEKGFDIKILNIDYSF